MTIGCSGNSKEGRTQARSSRALTSPSSPLASLHWRCSTKRAHNKTGPLSVHAIPGPYVVLLGLHIDEATSAGVPGFWIERVDARHGHKRAWFQALRVFPDVPVQEGPASTKEHPIQGFFWGDFTVRYGHAYTYRIVAMRGEPGALEPSETVEVEIATEKEDEGKHAV